MNEDLVPVTAGDRDAAAKAIGPGYSLDRATIRVGAADSHRLVQAFARHRLAAQGLPDDSSALTEAAEALLRMTPAERLDGQPDPKGVKDKCCDPENVKIPRDARCPECPLAKAKADISIEASVEEVIKILAPMWHDEGMRATYLKDDARKALHHFVNAIINLQASGGSHE